MKIGVLAVTERGWHLGQSIVESLDESSLLRGEGNVAENLRENWTHYDGFVCIMAAGIVVRSIAPLIRDKETDPCVLVIDDRGKHVISLLSGHLGGGNRLTQIVADIIGGRAVITTASDLQGLVPLDIWAKEQNLAVEHRRVMTSASSMLVNQGNLKIHADVEVESLPNGLQISRERHGADILISNRTHENILTLHPKNLVVGVGCNRGTPQEEFEEALEELFQDLRRSRLSIRNLASIDLKNDEEGLLLFAEKNDWNIEYFPKEEINRITNVEISAAAMKGVGAIGVAEPSALLSAKTTILLSRKRKWKNITMAVAEAPFLLSARVQAPENI